MTYRFPKCTSNNVIASKLNQQQSLLSFNIYILKVHWSGKNFFLDKCILSHYAQINTFYNSILLCLRVITSQMFYDIISALHGNVIVGPGRLIIPGVTTAECVCSSFSIKNDNGSEVCSPVISLRGFSEYYSMPLLHYYLCSRLVQAWVEVLFEPKCLTGEYSLDCKVGSFVE